MNSELRSTARCHRSLCLAAALLVLLLPSSRVLADDEANLKERFKSRYPKILKLQSQGAVGETMAGYIEAVNADVLKDAETKKLIEDENRDRRALYEMIARQQKTTPEIVGERNAIRKLAKADPGDYFKGKDGRWRQKREMKSQD